MYLRLCSRKCARSPGSFDIPTSSSPSPPWKTTLRGSIPFPDSVQVKRRKEKKDEVHMFTYIGWKPLVFHNESADPYLSGWTKIVQQVFPHVERNKEIKLSIGSSNS